MSSVPRKDYDSHAQRNKDIKRYHAYREDYILVMTRMQALFLQSLSNRLGTKGIKQREVDGRTFYWCSYGLLKNILVKHKGRKVFIPAWTAREQNYHLQALKDMGYVRVRTDSLPGRRRSTRWVYIDHHKIEKDVDEKLDTLLEDSRKRQPSNDVEDSRKRQSKDSRKRQPSSRKGLRKRQATNNNEEIKNEREHTKARAREDTPSLNGEHQHRPSTEARRPVQTEEDFLEPRYAASPSANGALPFPGGKGRKPVCARVARENSVWNKWAYTPDHKIPPWPPENEYAAAITGLLLRERPVAARAAEATPEAFRRALRIAARLYGWRLAGRITQGYLKHAFDPKGIWPSTNTAPDFLDKFPAMEDILHRREGDARRAAAGRAVNKVAEEDVI